jgi:hypothetical protein
VAFAVLRFRPPPQEQIEFFFAPDKLRQAARVQSLKAAFDWRRFCQSEVWLDFYERERGRMAKQPYETERWAILREYDSWARKNPDLANKGDPILFFSYLQSERSDLLDFKSRSVDKWQRVHGWLLSSGRVKRR